MPNANASSAVMRGRVPRAVLLAAALGGVTLLLASGHVPCGFAQVFHVPCPGCGSTRAMLALASGDLGGWLRHNPLAPFMTALVVALAVQAFASVLATGTFQRVGSGWVGTAITRGVMLVGVLEVVVWLARFGGLFGGPVPV